MSVLDRKRRLTQWDIKPPGYENVTAEQAKLSGEIDVSLLSIWSNVVILQACSPSLEPPDSSRWTPAAFKLS